MTDTITLPRSVVEQALEALKYERDANNPLDWHHDKTMTALCAALEQPQVNSPEIPEGWRLVPVEPTPEMMSAMIDNVSLVNFERGARNGYRAMLAAALEPPVVGQPQVEQEPFAVLVRKHSWHLDTWEVGPQGNLDYGRAWADERINVYTHPQNLNCKSTQARLATLWGYEKPQPPRQPLTDKVIQELAEEGVFHANIFEIVRRIEEEHEIFKMRAGIGGEA